MNNGFVLLTETENVIINGGGIEEAVGYAGAATSCLGISSAIFGTITTTQAVAVTGALVVSGTGMGLLAVGLAGAAVYNLFN